MSLYTVTGPHPKGWPTEAAASFVTRMVDGFPCVFGVDAVRKGTLRFAFIPTGPDRHIMLAQALNEFAQSAHEVGKRPSLVCFFEPDHHETLEDYHDLFWGLLQWLHKTDSEEWPPSISTDPNDVTWEFSYAGVPFFVVASTPAHHHRHSRYSSVFTIAFQPRFAFDMTPSQDAKARALIRKRLAAYDEIPPSPELGHYGESPEWRQYFLRDDNGEIGPCPFHP